MESYKDYRKIYDELVERDESESRSLEYWNQLVDDIMDFVRDTGAPADLHELASFSLAESAGMMRDAVALIIEHEKRRSKDDEGGNNGKG